MKGKILRVSTVLVCAAVLAGCQLSQTSQTSTASRPAPKPKPAPQTRVKGSMVHSWQAFPTGHKASSALLVEKIAPAQIQRGADYDYEIHATNLTEHDLYGVTVTDHMPTNYELGRTNPKANVDGSQLTWDLGKLAAGEKVKITVTGSAQNTGSLTNCASGSYVLLACVTSEVVEPALRVTKTAPDEVLICDPIPLTFTVTNTGTGVAKNVMLRDELPDGLMTTGGKGMVTADAGDLQPGESKKFTATIKASKTGRFVNQVKASGSGGLSASAKTTTVVRQPVLEIDKFGPNQEFIGRDIRYSITVTNTGDGVAAQAMLTDDLPAGATVVDTAGGKVAGGTVTWALGDLKPGAKVSRSVTVRADSAGVYRNSATAKADCAKAVSDTVATTVSGIPAILLEVVDSPDPVLVGTNTTYTITVTNQGSADGTGITISATLEDAMEYVSNSGATNGRARGRTVTFAPLAKLAPQDKATWKVVVKASETSDVRFKVDMNSDQLGRDVTETEATNFYK